MTEEHKPTNRASMAVIIQDEYGDKLTLSYGNGEMNVIIGDNHVIIHKESPELLSKFMGIVEYIKGKQA